MSTNKPTEDRKGPHAPTPSDTSTAGLQKPSGSLGTSGPNPGPSRIIGSQAKKQEEVTRHGTQKMKFVPTLPVRRKKPDGEVKQEEVPSSGAASQVERGKGRGRGRGLGRGRGGVAAALRPEMQMVASGPFAMGPALGGSSKKRTPRSNFTPVIPSGTGSASLGAGLSRTGAPSLNREKVKDGKEPSKEDEDVEVYSDPDEGVQIVDMNAIKTMDWMAPESLRRERNDGKRSKKKKEEAKTDTKGKGISTDDPEAEVEVKKNLANALDLSDSEEEEEMEDLIEDFAMDNLDMEDDDSLTRQEKLYFFQFPYPFPTFSGEEEGVGSGDAMVVDGYKPPTDDSGAGLANKGKKVSFAQDVKPPVPIGSQDNNERGSGAPVAAQEGTSSATPGAEKRLDGIIGQLEVHRSGMIKMQLNNGMVMDVTAATQPSFLQHAVFLDPNAKRLHVLGEVNRRFVVSPDVDKLLEEMDKAAKVNSSLDGAMDITGS